MYDHDKQTSLDPWSGPVFTIIEETVNQEKHFKIISSEIQEKTVKKGDSITLECSFNDQFASFGCSWIFNKMYLIAQSTKPGYFEHCQFLF